MLKRSHRFEDLTGQVFGRLAVLEEASGRKRRGAVWLCKCQCGVVKKVYASQLKKSNGTRSCGCLHKEVAQKLIKNLHRSGEGNGKWLGGDRNYGSIAYCRKILRKAEDTARQRGYLPIVGISAEELSVILQNHSGKCDLCGRVHESGKRPLIDHDHLTGRFRGLLCSTCNGIVVARCDSIPDFLDKLCKYTSREVA